MRTLRIPFLLIAVVVVLVPFAVAQHDHGHRPVPAVAVHSHPDADHVAVEDMHRDRRYDVRYTAVWDGPDGRYHSWQRVH